MKDFQNPPSRDESVIIIGAGIGGLAAGIALSRLGLRVKVFDRVRELRPVGAGISLWSNGVKVINWLGLVVSGLSKPRFLSC